MGTIITDGLFIGTGSFEKWNTCKKNMCSEVKTMMGIVSTVLHGTAKPGRCP